MQMFINTVTLKHFGIAKIGVVKRMKKVFAMSGKGEKMPRLIDANALTDHFIALCNYDGITVIRAIQDAPTIEPERKKGKWIIRGKQMVLNLENAREQYSALGYPHRNIQQLQCSECRKITLVDESILYEYCPHCGCDMRQEGEDHE